MRAKSRHRLLGGRLSGVNAALPSDGTFHEPALAAPLPTLPPLPFRRGEGRGEGSLRFGSPTVDCGLRTVDRGLWTALCQCETPHCPDLHLTLEDITPLEANRAKLGRALC